MIYTPDWEPISSSLKRLLAAGVSDDEARSAICHAVADRKINIRVRIAQTAEQMRGKCFQGGNVRVPTHLAPNEIEWARSYPFKEWSIGPQPGEHYFWDWADYPIDLIELSTSDVTSVLDGPSAALIEQSRIDNSDAPAFDEPTPEQIVFALDHRAKKVLFRHGVEFDGNIYRLFAQLAPRFETEDRSNAGGERNRPVSAPSLAKKLRIEEASLRRVISRARNHISKSFLNAFGRKLRIGDVIQSRPWHGYSLNPKLVCVDSKQIDKCHTMKPRIGTSHASSTQRGD